MLDDIKQHVTTCETCRSVKPLNQVPAGEAQSLQIPGRRWEIVSVDFITGLPKTKRGHNSIAVFVDRLTKMAHFVLTHDTVSAQEFAVVFRDQVWKHHGLCKDMLSDREPRFTSRFWSEVCKLLDIKQDMSTAFHPQSDGKTERMNRTLEDMLRCYIGPEVDTWDDLLASAEFACNNSVQESVRNTPFFLNHGQHPLIPLSQVVEDGRVPSAKHFTTIFSASIGEAQKALLAAQSRQRDLKKRRHVEYAAGEEVWLSSKNISVKGPGTRKLMPRWLGPLRVVKQCGPVAYELELPQTMNRLHPVFHVSLLQRYVPPAGGRRKRSPDPIVLDSGELEWEVEAILYHRERKYKKRGKTAYNFFIKWKGYGMEEASWETAEHLSNCEELLQEY